MMAQVTSQGVTMMAKVTRSRGHHQFGHLQDNHGNQDPPWSGKKEDNHDHYHKTTTLVIIKPVLPSLGAVLVLGILSL